MWVLDTVTCPYPGTLSCPLVPCSLLPGTAIVDTCPDWRVSAWTLWGLESSMAGRTKAWSDIQAQNARAKVKKSDRQTDIVVYMSNRGRLCPLWSWPPPPGCWPLGLGSTGHGAVTGAGDRGVGRGHCPCLGTDLRIFGRGPCASCRRGATRVAPPAAQHPHCLLHTVPWGPQDLAGQGDTQK